MAKAKSDNGSGLKRGERRATGSGREVVGELVEAPPAVTRSGAGRRSDADVVMENVVIANPGSWAIVVRYASEDHALNTSNAAAAATSLRKRYTAEDGFTIRAVDGVIYANYDGEVKDRSGDDELEAIAVW